MNTVSAWESVRARACVYVYDRIKFNVCQKSLRLRFCFRRLKMVTPSWSTQCVRACDSHIPHNHSSEIKCFDLREREIGKIVSVRTDLRKLNKKTTYSLDCRARIFCGARSHIYTSVNLKFKSEISSENVLHNLISSLKSNRRHAGIKCDVSECECIFNYSVSALAFE